MTEQQESALKDLVCAATRVLRSFKNGNHPTFDQIDKLEATLVPFITLKICGHKLLEECDCLERAE